MARICSAGVMPSGPVSVTFFSICRFRPATRTMKNSSRFEPTNDRNINRSSRGLRLVLRLFQHAPLKIEQAQLAIHKQSGSVELRRAARQCGCAVSEAADRARRASYALRLGG